MDATCPFVHIFTSAMWVLKCLFMLNLSENFCPHTSHSYGFSPVWVRMCRIRSFFDGDTLPHSGHTHPLLVPSPITLFTIPLTKSLLKPIVFGGIWQKSSKCDTRFLAAPGRSDHNFVLLSDFTSFADMGHLSKNPCSFCVLFLYICKWFLYWNNYPV